MTMQIIDEPAASSRGLHPLDEAYELRIIQMMREK
jgi:hypothetical protein